MLFSCKLILLHNIASYGMVIGRLSIAYEENIIIIRLHFPVHSKSKSSTSMGISCVCDVWISSHRGEWLLSEKGSQQELFVPFSICGLVTHYCVLVCLPSLLPRFPFRNVVNERLPRLQAGCLGFRRRTSLGPHCLISQWTTYTMRRWRRQLALILRQSICWNSPGRRDM